MEERRNYYEVLEVPTSATMEDIHQGYIRSKNAYSGDSVALYSLMTEEECSQILDVIEEAYAVLSEPIKRREYDTIRGIKVEPVQNQTSLIEKEDHSRYDNSMFMDNSDYPKQSNVDYSNDFNIQRKDEAQVSKINARRIFSLDFDIDPKIEEEIENCTNFSGQFLQKIREYKQVSIERMSDMTKISKTHLRNLESDAYDRLPAVVYTRGFVYQFAKCLKLNPEMVATSYIHNLKMARNENKQ